MNVQKESNDVINFQPIPKDLVMELIFGPDDEEFAESLSIPPPPEEATSGQTRLLQSSEGDSDDDEDVESPFQGDPPSDSASFNPLMKSFSLT